MATINRRDVGTFIKNLGHSFDLTIVGHMLVPSTDPADRRSVLVVDNSNSPVPRDNVLRQVHNAFLDQQIAVPPFESEPFSELLTVEEWGLLLFVRKLRLVHAHTDHHVYTWGERPK